MRRFFIVIRAEYERQTSYGRSLEWIAPELGHAGLTMREDRAHDPRPSRIWAGIVDSPTFERFAEVWHLNNTPSEPRPCLSQNGTNVGRAYTFDGMNWEQGGESPIVYVSVQVFEVAQRQPERLRTTEARGHYHRGA